MKEKKDKKFNIYLILFRLISIIIIIICLILLYNWNKENNENSILSDELSDSFIIATSEVTPKTEIENENETSESNPITYESIEVNFKDLLSQNPQTVGWIKINNTNINFPIVQSQDNNFYLKHNFKRNYNSAGWIFADYTNNFDTLDQNTIIYGHNRQNGSMFSNLNFLLKQNWFNDDINKTFIFNTKNNKYIAEIFSVYKINKNILTLNTSFENETDFAETITSWKEKSVCSFDITPDYKDNIITLCTCDNNTQYRIVIHAKLINVD